MTKASLPNIKDVIVNLSSVSPGVIATQMNDFHGLPPTMVATAVLEAVTGRSDIPSGGDVNVF